MTTFKDHPRLSAVKQEEYVRLRGTRCPFCGDRNLEPQRLEADGDVAWQAVTCPDCGEGWEDVYTLTEIDLD